MNYSDVAGLVEVLEDYRKGNKDRLLVELLWLMENVGRPMTSAAEDELRSDLSEKEEEEEEEE